MVSKHPSNCPGNGPVNQQCWCDSGSTIEQCCGPLVSGQAHALTRLALMGSRYSAFVTGNAEYLRHTWHRATRPSSIQLEPQQHWLGLKIVGCRDDGDDDDVGEVEFVARYKLDGRGYRLHELSRFEPVDDRWVYVDGRRFEK